MLEGSVKAGQPWSMLTVHLMGERTVDALDGEVVLEGMLDNG